MAVAVEHIDHGVSPGIEIGVGDTGRQIHLDPSFFLQGFGIDLLRLPDDYRALAMGEAGKDQDEPKDR